jgi:hypothetical protein
VSLEDQELLTLPEQLNSLSVFSRVRASQEELEDIKGVIKIRISKKNMERNGQKKKYKRTNNDIQNIHIKIEIEKHEPD